MFTVSPSNWKPPASEYPPPYGCKITSDYPKSQCTPLFAVYETNTTCAFNATMTWKIVSSANAVLIGHTVALRVYAWMVLFFLSAFFSVFGVVVELTPNNREASVRASSSITV
jgi:hypothetical protein